MSEGGEFDPIWVRLKSIRGKIWSECVYCVRSVEYERGKLDFTKIQSQYWGCIASTFKDERDATKENDIRFWNVVI
jgi:hypothetical protein